MSVSAVAHKTNPLFFTQRQTKMNIIFSRKDHCSKDSVFGVSKPLSSATCLAGAGLRDSATSLTVLLRSEHLCSCGHNLSVGRLGFLALFGARSGGGFLGALTLESNWGDQALDLGGLAAYLGVLFSGLELSSDDVASDIVFLVQVEKLSDLVGSLGPKSSVD